MLQRNEQMDNEIYFMFYKLEYYTERPTTFIDFNETSHNDSLGPPTFVLISGHH